MSLPRMSTMALAMLVAGGVTACRLQAEPPPVIADPRGDDPSPQDRLAPDFTLPSHDGGRVALGDLVANGPAIVVFYRGHW